MRRVSYGRDRANLYRGWGTRLYEHFAGPVVHPLHARVVERMASSLVREARVLDVGSGPGDLLLSLAQRRGDLRLIGADPAASAVDRLDRRARSAGAGNVRSVRAPVERLPFPDGVFHLVVSIGALKHWNDAVRGLAEIHRVLPPGGAAWLFELDPDSGDERFAGVQTDYPAITRNILRRGVFPRSLSRSAVRWLIEASDLQLIDERAEPDLPFYAFEVRRG